MNASLYKKLNFNFLRDIDPVAGFVRVPNVMEVHPSVPAKNVAEFIAYVKANPGKVNVASSGNGTSIHLSGELFKMMTGIQMTHVPYKGSAPMLTDLLGGQVQVTFDNLPPSISHIKAGKLRALGGDHGGALAGTCRTCRRSPKPCRAMRRAPFSGSARPRVRRTRSSTSSTRRSISRSRTRRCSSQAGGTWRHPNRRHAGRVWQDRCGSKPPSGKRSSTPPICRSN